MTREPAPHLIEILDWFVMEGGDVSYGHRPCVDGTDPLDPDIFDVHFDDIDVYVGPPTAPGAWVADVAVLLRPAISLATETVASLVAPTSSTLHPRFDVEIVPSADNHDDSAVWLICRLSDDDVFTSRLDELLAALMSDGRRLLATVL